MYATDVSEVHFLALHVIYKLGLDYCKKDSIGLKQTLEII